MAFLLQDDLASGKRRLDDNGQPGDGDQVEADEVRA